MPGTPIPPRPRNPLLADMVDPMPALERALDKLPPLELELDAPGDDDDESAAFDHLAALASAFSSPGVELEQQLGGMLREAFSAMRSSSGAVEALDRRVVTEDGREVRLVVAPVEGFAKQLSLLGGIEGVTEMMLISFGATTETEGDPLMADVALALRAGEPIDMTIRTPRHAVRFSMVNREAWQAAQSEPTLEKLTAPSLLQQARGAPKPSRPKAKPGKVQPRTVPASVALPSMLRPRAARGGSR